MAVVPSQKIKVPSSAKNLRARAAIGQAAAPPSSATNSRRLMPDMGGPSLHGLPHHQPATGAAGRSMGPSLNCSEIEVLRCTDPIGPMAGPGHELKGSGRAYRVRFAPDSRRSRVVAALRVRARSGHCARLFDHLVGEGEHTRRNCEAKRFGSLEVDQQLKFGRPDDRKVGGLFALKYPADINAGLAKGVGVIRGVAHQAAPVDVVATGVDRRYLVPRRKRQNLVDVAKCKGADDERPSLALDERLEGHFVVAIAASFQDSNLPPECTRRRKKLAALVFVCDRA